MELSEILGAIAHAVAQAQISGKPWAIYDCDGVALTVAPAGSQPGTPLEVCWP